MEFIQPSSWADALAAQADNPETVPIAGGSDIMVEINFDRRRPPALLDLTRVPELQTWDVDDGHVRVGAGMTYARVITELGDRLPGPGIASRSIGSPQIRNRATVAGNVATASPAGDALPPLLAAGASIEVESAGERTPDHPRRRVLRRPQAQRPATRRAHRRHPHPDRARSPAVLQDRHPQRHGDRGGLVRRRRSTRTAAGRHRHRIGRTDATAGAGPPRSWQPPRSIGTAAARSTTISPDGSASWWPARPRRSTTSAARRPTGGTRWASWLGATLTWVWDELRSH